LLRGFFSSSPNRSDASLKRVHNGQKREGPALLRVVNDSVTVGTGFVDHIDLKKPHGRH
jgi:hypothetical protein